MNKISAECIRAINSDNRIRIINAYDTLATLVQALFNKKKELDLGELQEESETRNERMERQQLRYEDPSF